MGGVLQLVLWQCRASIGEAVGAKRLENDII